LGSTESLLIFRHLPGIGMFRRVELEEQHDIAANVFMDEIKAYSVRVELLRPQKTGYTRLASAMYKNGFRHLIKGRAGEWIRLPRGSFFITTAEHSDLVKRTAMSLAVAIDETALVKLAPVVNWAA
jgi:hypothetical protein